MEKVVVGVDTLLTVLNIMGLITYLLVLFTVAQEVDVLLIIFHDCWAGAAFVGYRRVEVYRRDRACCRPLRTELLSGA